MNKHQGQQKLNTVNDLIAFYSKVGLNEWKRVLNQEPVNPFDDQARAFCDGVLDHVVMAMVKRKFSSPDRITRLLGGIRLYQRWRIDHKFRKDWN